MAKSTTRQTGQVSERYCVDIARWQKEQVDRQVRSQKDIVWILLDGKRNKSTDTSGLRKMVRAYCYMGWDKNVCKRTGRGMGRRKRVEGWVPVTIMMWTKHSFSASVKRQINRNNPLPSSRKMWGDWPLKVLFVENLDVRTVSRSAKYPFTVAYCVCINNH